MKENNLASHTEILIRKTNNENKVPLKEKFVVIYEAFFKGEDPSHGSKEFWNELLLLKVNFQFIERCIILTSEEQLMMLKSNIHEILHNCCLMLLDSNELRVKHAFQTIAIFLKSIFRKKFSNFGVDVLNMLGGLDKGDLILKNLISGIIKVLTNDNPAVLKELSVDILSIFVTATENLNQNTILEYLVIPEIFDALSKVFSMKDNSEKLEYTSLFVLAVLSNYQKYETKNVFIAKISQLQSGVVVESFLNVVSLYLNKCIVNYYEKTLNNKTTGVFSVVSVISGWIGSWISQQQTKEGNPNFIGSLLLLFYELVNSTKRPFLDAIVTSHEKHQRYSAKKLNKEKEVDFSEVKEAEPLNLIHEFIMLCSYLFNRLNTKKSFYFAKLALVILKCMTEDIQFCHFLHETKHAPKQNIPIFKKVPNLTAIIQEESDKHPIVCYLLEVCLELLNNNLHVNLPAELHLYCLEVVHRILCYEKQFQVRLNSFRWLKVWTVLFRLIKFVTDPERIQKKEVQLLCERITTIFNLFITYGDTFLPDGSDYDFLYYEIIRVNKLLDDFYALVEKQLPNSVLFAQMENIKTITTHFQIRINKWAKKNPEKSLTPTEVTKVIKSNYESLKLTLLDNLDTFTPHTENPVEINFFRQLIGKILIFDFKSTITIGSNTESLSLQK